MGRRYDFHSCWRIDAPATEVWDVLHDAERYPEWWPEVREVRALERVQDPSGVGSLAHYRWRGPLPYTLSFEMRVSRAERPSTLSGSASGHLQGIGVWTVAQQDDGGTLAQFRWQVETTKRWMNLLGPVLRPLFIWSHDRVMRSGGASLARRLRPIS